MSFSSTSNRSQYTGNGATSSYDYTFKIFSQTDLLVTVRNTSGVETTLTITTDYTVDGVGDSGGGSISLVNSGQAWLTSGNLTTGYILAIRRVRPLTQTTDIRNQGSYFPETIEDEFDRGRMIDQQQQDEIDRSLKLPETISGASFDMSLPADLLSNGASKVPLINSSGDGFDTASTWPTGDQVVNAQTYAEAADTSKDLAEEWASKTDGIVDSTDYSSKAWAIGGTGVTDTASAGASKEWATETSSTVDGSEYSSKEYAVGTQTRGAANGGSSKDWATYTAGTVDDTEYSAKYYSQQAALSAAEAGTSAASAQWSDVSYKTNADSPITIADSDSGTLFVIDTSGGAVTVNLPAISGLTLDAPWVVGFKKSTTDSNDITINRNGTDTIDGTTSVTISRAKSGRNLIPDADGTPDDWTSIEFGEVPIDGDIVGTSDAQVLTNKTFDDEIVLKELASAPSTPASGYKAIYPKTDGLLYTLDDAGIEVPVGTGSGGGLDVFYNQDFEIFGNASVFSTGNNATPDAAATGTLDGAIADETSSPLSGDQSIKYTMGSSSADDFIINSSDLDIDVKQVGNYIGFTCYYTYNGDDDDIRFFVLDQDDAELTDSSEYIKTASVATRFSTSVYVPSGTTGIRYGFQVVTGNSGKIFLFDDIEFSSNPLAYKRLQEPMNILVLGSPTSSYTANTAIAFASTTSVTDFEGIFNTSTGVLTAPRRGLYTFDAFWNTNVAVNSRLYIAKGSAETVVAGITHSASGFLTGSATIFLEAGETASMRATIGWSAVGASRLSISYTRESEHIITPTKSGIETYLADTQAGFGSTNTKIPYFTNVRTNTIGRIGVVGNDSTNGFSFTASKKCLAFMSFCSNAAASNFIGISLNSSQLTSTVDTISVDDRVSLGLTNAANSPDVVSCALVLSPGDVLRPHTEGNAAGVAARCHISLTVVDFEQQVLSAIPAYGKVCVLKDVKSTNTAGGTFTSGGWITRTLNTKESGDSFLSLAVDNLSFTITLPGTYLIEAQAPAFAVAQHQTRLQNLTTATTASQGTSDYSSGSQTWSFVKAVVTVSSATQYALQHRCNTTGTTNGLGVAANLGSDETYSTVTITKIT